MKKKFNKVVGRISQEIAKRYNLKDYEHQIIVQSTGLYKHTYKHIEEFTSIDSYNYALSNINKIIKNPMFVYYDQRRKSLLYFGKYKDEICVVVKLRLKSNGDNYVATIYPVNQSKINRLKRKKLNYNLV